MSSLATTWGSLKMSIATALSPTTVNARTANGRSPSKATHASGTVDQCRANVGGETPCCHRPLRDHRHRMRALRSKDSTACESDAFPELQANSWRAGVR